MAHPYCTPENIESRIGLQVLHDLVDDNIDGAPSTDEISLITDAIERADVLIDARLGRRYSVPFATVPDRIKSLSEIIAVWHLWRRRTQYEPQAKSDYDEAMSELAAIAKGDEDLAGATAIDAGPTSNTLEREPEFTRSHYDSDGNTLDDHAGSMEVW